MLSPLEPTLASRPPDEPPPSPPPAPLQPVLLDRGLDSSPKGPPSPQVGKDSSFEDLEQFLATSDRWGQGPGGQSEPRPSGVKEEPLLVQLRITVKDIHNAIGECAIPRDSGRVRSCSDLQQALEGPFLRTAAQPAPTCRALLPRQAPACL